MDTVTSMRLVAPPLGSGDTSDGDGVPATWANVSSVESRHESGGNDSTLDVWKGGEALQSIYLGYLWVSLLIGLPGNILIAVVYVVVRHKRTCDWFIFYLSVYDCAVCLFAVPLYLSIETGVWASTGSDLACKVEQFTIFTSQFSSVLILGIIAVDRYLKICHPTKRSLNAIQARNIGVGTPMLAALVAAPLLVWEGNVDKRFCRIQDHYRHTLGVKLHLCSTLGFFIVIFVLVIFCYSQVCLAVRRRIQRHRENALKRKHLLQIPAFIQAISNVDEPAGSDPKLSQGKRKFSLFNIGSSRRLSVIAPWVKARLSLPNDTSGGVSSRASSRASGASSNSSLSTSLRRKKKRSVSSSAMILSEKGESGADEENKETPASEQDAQNAPESERNAENGTAQLKPHLSEKSYPILPDKVIVTDTMTDTEKEETFTYPDRSKPVPPLYKQNQVTDLDRSVKEFQCLSDRGRTLGAAFIFADAPVRRSLEEEWELEIARVARERRISTDSVLRRPSDPLKGKTSTATQALMTWISRWRRKTFAGSSSKSRQQRVDAKVSALEETEKMFPRDAETSFSIEQAHGLYNQNALTKRGIEIDDPQSSLIYGQFRFQVSPSTPKSSLRLIGRQKTSIEETMPLAADQESCKPEQGLLQVEHSPLIQGSSDSTSSCLSLFDHVVCVHQAESPGKHPTSELHTTPKMNQHNASNKNLKGDSGELFDSCAKSSSYSLNGFIRALGFNKSDSHITENMTQIHPDSLGFRKSQSLSSSNLRRNVETLTKTGANAMSIQHTENRVKQNFPPASRHNSSANDCRKRLDRNEPSFGYSTRSQSLPERLKRMSRPQDSSDELLIDGSNSQQDSMKKPFSFPLIDQPFSSRQPCAGRKTNKTGAYRSRLTNRPKEDKRKHIKYSPLPLKREHYVDDMIDCADDFQLTNLERNGHDKGGGGLENISDSTNFNERGRGTLDASYGENVFLHRTIHLAKGNFERSHPHRNKRFAPGLGSESIKNSPTYNAYNSPRSISQALSKARNSNESVLNSHGVYNNNKDAAFDILLERTSDSISTNPSGLQSNGFFRSYSDNGSMDKERGKTLSTLPLNQVSLSTHVIGVSNDLQNSDLYRRRMSPKREKNLRFASKSADKLHNVSSSAFTAVAKDPRSVEKQSDSGVPDLSTESSCPINISNITTESFDHSSGVKRKGSNAVESSRSGSSPSLYVSAQASKSYNDSASASFVSCASSVCSNNVFTYPTARDWAQTAKRHLSDYSRKEESNGDIGLLYDGTFQSPHTTMPSQVTDGLKNNKRSTELNDPGMPFRLSSNVDGESGQSFSEAKRPVSWSSEDCHIFNNTTGCHTLYSPLESPQDESAQAASLSSLETIPFCNIQLPSDFHNSNGSEDQQNQSSSVCLGHSTSQNSSDSFTSHWKDASYSGKRDSRKQKESLPAKPNKNSKESGINKLFNMVNDPRKSLSSLHLAIPLVGHTSVNMDPRICSLCLIFQLHNHCFNTSSITRQTHLVYDVHSSLFQLPYLCLPTYPIFVSDSSYLFQCLHLHLILPQDCFHAEQQPLQVPSTVSDDTILPLLRSITDIHIPPITNLDNRFAVGNTWPFASISPDYISIKSGKKMQVVSAASNLEIVDKAKTMYKDKQTEKENNRSEVRAVDDISNDALPGTVGSDLDKLITTHCFNDLFSATESICKLNTRISTCPDDSPFQSVKYMCSPAFDFSEMSPKHFDDEVLRSFFYCTPSWFYSICRCRKEGILSWSLEEPVRLNSDLSKLVSNHFHQNVYRALPLTWQSMCFHNLQLDGRKFSDGTLTLQSDSAMCHPEMSKSRGSNHMPRAQSVNSSLTLSAPLSSASDKTCANSARGDIPVGSKYFSADNNHHGNKISVPEPKKRTWSLSKGEGCIFKFHKPWAQSRSTRSEHSNASSPGSPVVKRTSLRKRAVIAAGIRDSLIGETLISLLPTTDQANTGGSSAETSGQSCPNSDPDQRSVNCDQNGTPRTPPSSFPGGTFPPIAAKTVHSALMKCVPTLTCPEPVQSPSEKSGRYQPSNYASAAESTVNTPTSAGSGTPSSTCEIFVRSIFDAFVTGNGFISSSEPCLPIFSLPGNTAENGQDVGMPPLDVPLTPLLARNDNRRRSASTRGGENGESEPGASGTAAASVDIPGETSTSSASGAECKLYQLARKNREALLGSTHTFTLGSPTSVSPGGSSTITATGAATGGEGSDHQQTRPRKQSTLSHSWFSLDDLESTRKPSRFRLRSFYYLNSLRHQIERAFSVGHIRSFLGLGEAEVRKKRNASRKMTRDTLAANQINVIITRCESIILDRSAEEMEGQPLRDRSSSLDPCPGELNGSGAGGASGKPPSGGASGFDKWDKNLPQHHHYQHRHSADAASTTSSTNKASFDRMGKPRAASLDTARGSSFSQSDDMSSRGASLDLLSPASASVRTGSVCSGISTLSRLTECSVYTENSRSDCERITRRSAEREHNITKLLGVITFIFVISWSVSWVVIIGDTLGLTPDSAHASITYSGTSREGSPAATSGSGETSGSASAPPPGGSASTTSPGTHLTVSLARNLFLVNHFCNIVVYAWLSKSFREKLSECYKIVVP